MSRVENYRQLKLDKKLARAMQHFTAGRLPQAKRIYQQVRQSTPNHPVALHMLGFIAYRMGEDQNDIVVDLISQAVAIAPDYIDAHNNLGNALRDSGKFDEAVASYQRAIALEPNYANAHNNLGIALKELGRVEEAVASYRKALALEPNYAKTHYNLGIALKELGQGEEAVGSYRRALALNPKYYIAHNNLGTALKELGRVEEAVGSYRRAIEIKPDHIEAHHNLGLILLLLGQMEEGWAESEWRLRVDGGERHRYFSQAPWRGEPLQGKTILVWGEQGIGDEVLYAGMVPDLIDAGARVVLECSPRLMPLYRRSFPDVECIAGETPPAQNTLAKDIDYQVPGGGLGRWLRPDLESFSHRRPYLAANEDRRQALREHYGCGDGGLLVGIAWYSKSKLMGAQKSLSLGDFLPLAKIPGVTLVDLQYGDWADERRAFEKETGVAVLHDDGIDQMADLDAFAAQVAAMDLIVSVSNTTVHFGGALGVPTWVLLNTVPLCVWMLERDDSLWYPSVTLFRQTRAGEWADVIGRVTGALQDFSTPESKTSLN